MTHYQFPEYEFEPTLTTSELYNARIDACAKYLRKRYWFMVCDYADVANRFEGDVEKAVAYCEKRCAEYEGDCVSEHDERIDSIIARCVAIIDRMPFEAESAKNIKARVSACDTATELLWNFFFEFHCEPIASELRERFPDVMRDLAELEADNAKLYA